MGTILDGKAIAQKHKESIRIYVEGRVNKGLRPPCMATILVGNDGGSLYYVQNQKKICEKLGVITKLINLNEDITSEELLEVIENLNSNNDIDGIILQLPLPKHIDEKYITSKICSKKDIDGLTDINLGKFFKGEEAFVPCTPRAVIEIIKNIGVNIGGKNAVVVGRSNIVGKPVAQLLLNENATVTICHSKTKNLQSICKNADILIAAIGKPKFITKDFIKKDAIVIDVGTSSVNGKITGDVCFEEVIDIAGYITPVPGGVGALTTTMLIRNTCEALEKNVY